MFNSFRIKSREVGSVSIIETDGYINNSAGDEIADLCHQLIENGRTKILVDMTNSNMINSVGVSIFIEVIERLNAANGTLAFCNLVPIVKKTFDIMGITKFSTIYKSEEEAISALES